MVQLIVFEGIDGVGKTTLAIELTKRMSENTAKYYSFPGKEKAGSLGQFVYDLHHGKKTIVSEMIPPLSLQMLHVASHITNLKNSIFPLILDGGIVVLDRWWWSTMAYGIASGIQKSDLQAIVQPELSLINENIKDILIVYLSRKSKTEHITEYEELLLNQYENLVRDSKYPVIHLDVDNKVEKSKNIEFIMEKLSQL